MKQNGQPVAYASRALTQTESHYAQIEKELLVIVFACEQFTDYIYGRASVNIETVTHHWRSFSGNLLVKHRSVFKGCFYICKSSTFR